MTAGLAAALAAWRYSGEIPRDFYNAAVQINPVFLVALALEQNLAETLGTKAQYVNAKVDETQTRVARRHRDLRRRLDDQVPNLLDPTESWSAPATPEVGGQVADYLDEVASRIGHPREKVMGEVMVAALEQGGQAARVHIRDVGALLAAVSAMPTKPVHVPSLAEASGVRMLDRARVVTAYLESHLDQVADRAATSAAEEARDRYDEERRRRRLSLLAVISVLILGEVAAVIGLLSPPGFRNAWLFPATMGLLAAAFTTVTVGALRELATATPEPSAAGPSDTFAVLQAWDEAADTFPVGGTAWPQRRALLGRAETMPQAAPEYEVRAGAQIMPVELRRVQVGPTAPEGRVHVSGALDGIVEQESLYTLVHGSSVSPFWIGITQTVVVPFPSGRGAGLMQWNFDIEPLYQHWRSRMKRVTQVTAVDQFWDSPRLAAQFPASAHAVFVPTVARRPAAARAEGRRAIASANLLRVTCRSREEALFLTGIINSGLSSPPDSRLGESLRVDADWVRGLPMFDPTDPVHADLVAASLECESFVAARIASGRISWDVLADGEPFAKLQAAAARAL
ncbi:hypothetical protein [Paraconexibacter algicola]|uniref:Uncharacterized protein n=1 Tax=Paraconexibacter algicola TaxID=2133960 RepID=A0A2T4UI42_9ACTN|nr:hypothetical protein [Paraconexibacter algicola]PTL58888.1 hypothetical protein C7Y72_04080 [Paraconexibacter algicola]